MPRHSGEERGFTLIELALVVAILGILTAVAIPAYQDYLIQRDVNSGLLLVNGLQGSIETYRRRTGTWPTAANLNDTVSFQKTNSNVRSIVVLQDGVIEIEFDDKGVTPPLRMKTIELTPYANAQGDVLWQCGGPWTLNAVVCGERLQLDMKM
jgi:type IV pilus assembly protein PilA